MELNVSTTYLNWSPSSSQTLASAISSPSSLGCRYVHRLDRWAMYGTPTMNLYRSRSLEHSKSRTQRIKRSCSASLDAFSDEEFSNQIQELALRFQLSDDDDDNDVDTDENTNNAVIEVEPKTIHDFTDTQCRTDMNFVENQTFPSSKLEPVEPPDWLERDEIIPASIERKANSVDLPLSLRIIKRKKQWQEGFTEAGESAYCSVKKAFSSMVFIIREIQSYTLQMRQVLLYEDLQGILVRVQKEMHASFVWLFQQVFSHTPTLMVYVMILLANYSVYSMGINTSLAATPPPETYATTMESVLVNENQKQPNFDSSTIKRFSVLSSSGNTASIGGGNRGGGGGKFRQVASGTDGDGRFDESVSAAFHRTAIGSSITSEEELVSGQVVDGEEVRLWNSTVEDAARMQDEALDHETMQTFVSPISAKVEEEDYADYFRTELLYQTGLVHEPNNPLLLANYAQFLYLVTRDYNRAEEYFKRAVNAEPKDAEALNKYASFLWQVRKDLCAAEETYLEAISADPSNSYYAANYAHFLWNTGGEDTCFPLSSPDATTTTNGA